MQTRVAGAPRAAAAPLRPAAVRPPLPSTSPRLTAAAGGLRRRQPAPLPAPPPRSVSGGGGAAASPDPPAEPPTTLLGRVRKFFFGNKIDKESIAKLGAGGFLSYGLISNINYGSAIGVSWILFVRKYGVSPLGEQWGTFLAFYAATWTLQNFLRPARLALAIALAPSANRLIDVVGERTRLGRKRAFALLLAVMAVTMTSVLGLCLWAFGGFPPAPGGK
jgi:hypothetical protein